MLETELMTQGEIADAVKVKVTDPAVISAVPSV
jgi:hypothetical protein